MALHPQPDPAGELRGIALCAGVGGLELGLHIAEAGYRTVCYVEREAFPAATLVARMEDASLDQAPVWSDVRSFDGRPWRGRVHLIAGGYPCQPFSFAGKRLGQDDPRHLWPDFVRIIGEIRPEWCFFENVEGHLTLGAADVFSDLRCMGYTVKAGIFSALEVGATHLRRRLFILAHANEEPLLQPAGSGTVTVGHEGQERSGPRGQPVRARHGGEDLDDGLDADGELRSDADDGFQLPSYPPAPSEFAAWASVLKRRPDLQPELFGLADGMAEWMDRADAAGNGVVSLAAAYAWRTLKAAHAFDGASGGL